MSQLDLLSMSAVWQVFDLPGAQVRLSRFFLTSAHAEELLSRLYVETPWRQDTIKVHGQEVPLPRLHQWYGDPGATYEWSGIRMEPLPWTDRLLDVKRRVEERCGSEFNTVLLNLYRDGKDSVAWHSDDEPELGKEPVIASVSLGAERDFMLRRKDQHDRQLKLLLPHGSLLVMQGGTQADWEHCLPKRTLSGPRINLTFRVVQR